MKVFNWFISLLKRICLTILLIIIWGTAPVVICVYWLFIGAFVSLIVPVIWLLLGTTCTKYVKDAVFMHSNRKWWSDSEFVLGGTATTEKFWSIFPIYHYTISDYLIDKLKTS